MSDTQEQSAPDKQLRQAAEDVLAQIPQEREKEIISRRFGLYGSKETLEQIGDMLGITRERVRQLEKAILVRLHLLGNARQSSRRSRLLRASASCSARR